MGFKLILKSVLLQPFYNLLMFFVFLMPGHSLGLALITLTVLIRLALLPSTRSMTRQQALMGKLKPEIDALNEKHKDNKQAQAKALMDFYKVHKISPTGSCLPMILQLVVLITLYYALRIGVTNSRFDLLYSFTPKPPVVNPHFLWLNLSKPDRYLILPIIAGLLQFVQTFQMLPKNESAKGLAKYLPFLDKNKKDTASQDPMGGMQAQMTFLLPLVTVWVARGFPAALPLYWIISSLVSIAQQTYILKQTSKITVKQADEISASDNPDALLEADIKKNTQQSTKKGVTVTVRQKR